MERHIVPDNNVLHMIYLICCCHVAQLVQECKYECCVVSAHMGMAVEDPILCNGCTECYITPTLPWDIDYSPVANDVSSPPSCSRQVEPSLIYVNELMLDLLSSIRKTLKNSVRQNCVVQCRSSIHITVQ